MSIDKIIHYEKFCDFDSCYKLVSYLNKETHTIQNNTSQSTPSIICKKIENKDVLNLIEKMLLNICKILQNVYEFEQKIYVTEAILQQYENTCNIKEILRSNVNKCNKCCSILYLNGDFEGGNIQFVNCGIDFTPQVGDLVCFKNIEEHSFKISSIDKGVQYMLITWYSDTGFLNIFKTNQNVIHNCNYFNIVVDDNFDLNTIVFQHNFLNDLEIDEIEKCDDVFINSKIKMGDVNNTIRKSMNTWLSCDKYWWVYEKMFDYVVTNNKRNWKFNIFGVIDPIQYTQYKTNDFYDWHNDSGNSKLQYRKLSMVVGLTDDYDGGDLILFNSSKPIKYKLKKGDCILFPSFILHKVSKVKKGIRKTLVMWACGNNFI